MSALTAHLQITDRVEGEPLCCDEPMVHNSATGEFECASAYFLLEEHIPWIASAWMPSVEDEDVPAQYVEALQHWRASRTPDGWDLP